VTVADLKNNEAEHVIKAKFVFIGAGGAALKLLQESGIPEADDYAGFPVGVPGVRKPGSGESSSGKSVRSGFRGRAADVCSAHRHPYA
jgi:L-2-hydroxyglutarate oxidase LhgO